METGGSASRQFKDTNLCPLTKPAFTSEKVGYAGVSFMVQYF